jgi:hypothetical protein
MTDEEYRDLVEKNALLNQENLLRQAKILDLMESFWPKFIEMNTGKEEMGDGD